MEATVRLARVHDSDLIEYPEYSRFEDGSLTDDILELADDIETNGQLVPVMAIHDRSGKLVLVDGRRRLRAIRFINERRRRLGRREMLVRCEVIETLTDPMLASITCNWERRPLDPVDVAESIVRLRRRGYDVKRLARLYHRSEPWIYATEAIARLPDEVKKRIKETGMSWRAAVTLAARAKSRTVEEIRESENRRKRLKFLAGRLRQISGHYQGGNLLSIVADYVEGLTSYGEMRRAVALWLRESKSQDAGDPPR